MTYVSVKIVVIIAGRDACDPGVNSQCALELTGAETVDRAREMWWLGPRNLEKGKYTADGGHLQDDERDFRTGFEATLRLRNRNRSWDECYRELAER
jgi:hypothetical protein